MSKKLQKQIKKALICDKNCGHGLSLDTCFDHQVERIKKIIIHERRKLLEKFEKIISVEWDKK